MATGMGMGTATWATADAGITTVGAEAATTVGHSQQARRAGPYFLEAASPGGFFVHGSTAFGRKSLFGRASLP
jgi:hypothetical protein